MMLIDGRILDKGSNTMGSFLKSIGTLGLTSAATAAGGPIAGAGAAAGMGALGSLMGGGGFQDMLSSGIQGGLGQYLAGPTQQQPQQTSLLDTLNSQMYKNPLNYDEMDKFYKNNY